jgi:hypothetical protein
VRKVVHVFFARAASGEKRFRSHGSSLVYECLVPQLEGQKAPELEGIIALTSRVIADHLSNNGWFEQAVPPNAVLGEHVAQHFPQFILQP